MLFFCTNDQCARSFTLTELQENYPDFEQDATLVLMSPDVNDTTSPTSAIIITEDDYDKLKCPVCGSPLSQISIGEIKLLPENTPIFRRLYKRAGHPDIQATIVFSGIERRSIHRPQVCLVSQGSRITNEYTYQQKVSDTKTLPIKILEVSHAYTQPDGSKHIVSSIYAYWLFNPEREEHEHLARFWHMAKDNALYNYRPRWAYVSLTLPRDPQNPDGWQQELDDFVPRLYPTLEDVREKMREDRKIGITIERSADANFYEGDGPATKKTDLKK